jgi:hypothetical protein
MEAAEEGRGGAGEEAETGREGSKASLESESGSDPQVEDEAVDEVRIACRVGTVGIDERLGA